MSYRVKLQDDDGTVLVTSPDFSEVTTFGETTEDALAYAVGAFEEAIEARISARLEIPLPSKGKASDAYVVLPLQAELKVLLYQNMFKNDVRKADLARLMSLPRQEIDRLLDLNHATNFTKMERAFSALGKTLNIEVTNTR